MSCRGDVGEWVLLWVLRVYGNREDEGEGVVPIGVKRKEGRGEREERGGGLIRIMEGRKGNREERGGLVEAKV